MLRSWRKRRPPCKEWSRLAKEIGLDRMGEEAEDEDEDKDDNGGDTATPPTSVPPVATTPKEVVDEEDSVEMVPEQEAPVAHDVFLVDAEPKLPQLGLYRTLMRDYEKSPTRMMDDLDDLDASFNMDEWFLEDGSNDRD
jgi:hypothetical protein